MLSQVKFLEGIKYLNQIYLTWKFDTTNQLALRSWYSKFKALTDKDYIKLVMWYSSNKEYAPQSPVQLLNSYKEIFESQYPTLDDIISDIVNWLTKYDISDSGYRRAMNNAPYYIWSLNNGKGISYYTYCNLQNSITGIEINNIAKLIKTSNDEEVKNKCSAFALGKADLPLLNNGSIITREEELHGVKSEESKELYNGIKQLAKEFTE